ncbi:MAG: DUF6265 family protein [Gemmatimonadota bacterium]
MRSSTASSTTIAEPGRGQRRRRSRALWLLLFALGGFAPEVAAQQPAPPWLAGCWRQAEAGQITDEVWLPRSGGALLGMSRTVENDSLRSWELMLIREGPNGLAFEASPSGQAQATFLASAVSDSAIVFENLTHDYPQVIRYARHGADSLTAVVSGTIHDRQRAIEFHYARVSCPAQ